MQPVTVDNAADAARILKAFLTPFEESEIKLKPAMVKGNRCLALAYVDARLIMDRLDEVVGIDCWRDEYTVLPGGNEVECRLSVKIAGAWVTKADVGGQSEQPDEGDRMKAAYSDALKRAAVKFGIGRFLYRRPQQWMDYDPVKKQIIRPTAGTSAKPPAQAPRTDATLTNPALVAKYTQKLAQVKTRAEFESVCCDIGSDKKAGVLGEADAAALRAAAEQTAARFPRQPAGK